MKKYFLVLIVFFLTLSVEAQIFGEDEVYLDGGERIDAKFNGGGFREFYEYINKEFDFSKVSKSGIMIVSFTINQLGEIKNTRVVQLIDVPSAAEILRVLAKAPKWEPATRGGRIISVDVKIPLQFRKATQRDEKESTLNEKKEIDDTTAKLIKDNKIGFSGGFVGGFSEFKKFLDNNYRVPDVPGLKGKVLIRFTIDEEGAIVDIEVLKDLKYGTGEELIRVLKLTQGKWKPAQQQGKNVKATYQIPIYINVPNE